MVPPSSRVRPTARAGPRLHPAQHGADIGKHADGIVVGTVLVDAVAKTLVDGKATDRTVAAVRDLVADIFAGVKRARA